MHHSPIRLPFLALGLALASLAGCSKDQNTGPSDLTAQKKDQVEELFPDQSGTPTTGVLLGQPIAYQKIDGENIFQGDMMLTDAQLDPNQPQTEAAVKDFNRWPRGVVYYVVSGTLSESMQNKVYTAMDVMRVNTNNTINFMPRTTEENYVTFQAARGNGSFVGRKGGEQAIKLAATASMGNVLHEICHTLGFYHEHQRQDRKKHIKILTENIRPDHVDNFLAYSAAAGSDLGAFDFGSIMMYGSQAFSANGRPTITKLDGSEFTQQRRALSDGDKAAIQQMY